MANGKIIVVENRHHMLYPERAFEQAGANALKLRNYFVVVTPMYLHSLLHTTIDNQHDIGISNVVIDKTYLPNQGTLEKLVEFLERDKEKLDGYSALMKLQWLDFNLENNFENYWLKSLIRDEIKFFKEYAEELWR